MNPIKKIKQHNEALQMLHDAGYEGDLLTALNQALDTGDALAGIVVEYNKLAGVSSAETPTAERKTYFVSYLFEATQYANGGRRNSGSGNTMIHVEGGVREWQQIVGITEFIKNQQLAPHNINNAKVTVLGLHEVKS